MDAPRLKEDVWRRVIHHVAANEYEERRTAGYSAQESMRKRDLLALLHVSSMTHNIAVAQLYRRVETDRPDELVAHRAAVPAHPAIPSKEENLRRIRHLSLEYPDFSFQPPYTEVMHGDASIWNRVAPFPDSWIKSGRCKLYLLNYSVFVAQLSRLYDAVEGKMPGTVLRLDTLSFATKTRAWRYDLLGNMGDEGSHHEMLARAGGFHIYTAAPHFCSRSSVGVLALPQEFVLPACERGREKATITTHVSAPAAVPPMIWNYPTTWVFDPREFTLKGSPFEGDEETSTNTFEIAAEHMRRAICTTLSLRDTGIIPGYSAEEMEAMTGRSAQQLKDVDTSDEWLKCDIYASPYRYSGVDNVTGRHHDVDLTAEDHRANVPGFQEDLTSYLKARDQVRWMAAIDAPPCRACGWEALKPYR